MYSMLRNIDIKPIPVITVSHRLLMLKITYIRNTIIEQSITQITYISILTNIQLMLFNNYKIKRIM